MEVTLVHPNNRDQKVVATHPQQVAALQGAGFVEVKPAEKNSTEDKETK